MIDPAAFPWTDGAWKSRPFEETVIYEVHVGTATPEGTYAALADRLEALRDLGVTAIELLPLADFKGSRNWGYDGVLPYAPDSAYGTPDDLRRLVDRAHGLGLMVFLDVVYNHFGPAGNYLNAYAKTFFTERHQTPWGAGINFDGKTTARWCGTTSSTTRCTGWRSSTSTAFASTRPRDPGRFGETLPR